MVRPRLAAMAWVAAAAAASISSAGCSSPAAPLGQGGQCLQTTDCQQGLVCVTQANGAKACSMDLSSTVSTEEAGTKPALDAAAGDARAGEGGVVYVGAGDGGGSGMRDASGSPEAQAPGDSGSPGGDAGAGG